MSNDRSHRGYLVRSREQWLLKRRFLRARLEISVIAIRGMARRTLAVENLGAGGALLVGGSGWRIGETIDLELMLGGGALRVRAVVVRLEARRDEVGVAVQFKGLSADAEDALQDAAVKALERSWAQCEPAIVAVTSVTDDLRVLAPAIKSYGMRPVLVATFLDALRELQDLQILVKALVVDANAEGGVALEMLEWCAEAFPTVRRVLIYGDADQWRLQTAPWSAAAHAALTRPIERARLAVALGCRPMRLSLPLLPSSLPPAA